MVLNPLSLPTLWPYPEHIPSTILNSKSNILEFLKYFSRLHLFLMERFSVPQMFRTLIMFLNIWELYRLFWNCVLLIEGNTGLLWNIKVIRNIWNGGSFLEHFVNIKRCPPRVPMQICIRWPSTAILSQCIDTHTTKIIVVKRAIDTSKVCCTRRTSCHHMSVKLDRNYMAW